MSLWPGAIFRLQVSRSSSKICLVLDKKHHYQFDVHILATRQVARQNVALRTTLTMMVETSILKLMNNQGAVRNLCRIVTQWNVRMSHSHWN